MLIRNATLPDGTEGDVRIEGSRIAAVDDELRTEGREPAIDAAGLRMLPAGIDVHVHFREPGFTHKEDWASGTASAAAGGVGTVVDQPNTEPPTVTPESFDTKAELADAAHVDYGINGGVTPEWEPDGLFSRPLFALGEVFLADSTGDMGIEEGLFRDALDRAAQAAVTVTVHAEDAEEFDEGVRDRDDAEAWSDFRRPAAEVSAVESTIHASRDTDADLHLAHASVPEAVDRAVEGGLTVEATPHHLLLSRDDLPDLGTHGRMNPPLREEKHRAGLWDRLVEGTIDMVATDHAPHTREEKDASIWEAPSGVPGVATMIPLLAGAAERGELSYERVAAVTARRPAERFGLAGKGRIEPGYDADLVLLDPELRPIDPDALHTKCDWTPFEGWEAAHPELTLVRGRVVYEGGRVGRAIGENVRTIDGDPGDSG